MITDPKRCERSVNTVFREIHFSLSHNRDLSCNGQQMAYLDIIKNWVQSVVLLTSGFYILLQWVDFVCPQMSVAKVENCWLQKSYLTWSNSAQTIITHIQHIFSQANFARYWTVLLTKQGLLFHESHRCLGICLCLKTGSQTSVSRDYPTYYIATALFYNRSLC